MSIKARIIAALSVVVIFMAIQLGQAFSYQSGTQDLVIAAINKNYAGGTLLSEISVTGQQLRRLEKEFFIYIEDPARRAKYDKEWEEAYRKLDQQLDAIQGPKRSLFEATELEQFAQWRSALIAYGTAMRAIIADAHRLVGASGSGAQADGAARSPVLAANDAIKEGKDRFALLTRGATKMEQKKAADAATAATKIEERFAAAQLVTAVLSLLGIAIVLVLALVLPRSIQRPITALVSYADKMSKGDLNNPVGSHGTREFETLEAALERLRVAQAALLDRLRKKAPQPSQ